MARIYPEKMVVSFSPVDRALLREIRDLLRAQQEEPVDETKLAGVRRLVEQGQQPANVQVQPKVVHHESGLSFIPMTTSKSHGGPAVAQLRTEF